MMSKPIVKINLIAMGVCLTVLTLFGSWIASESIKPVTQIENRIINPVVSPGKHLIIRSAVYRHRLCATTIERTIFDGTGKRFVSPTISYKSAPGTLGNDIYNQEILVPDVAAPGLSRVIIGISWNCSVANELVPLKEIISLEFTIQ